MPVQIGPVTIGPPDQPSDQTEPDLSKPATGSAAAQTTAQAPTLTAAQQTAVDKLVTQYGAQAGIPTPALIKNNLGADVPNPNGTLTVTFGRGTQVEVGPNGEIGTIKAAPAAGTTTKPATPAAGLERLDANLQPIPAGSSTPTVYVRDPNAPAGTAPFKVEGDTSTLGDPSTWTPIHRDPTDPTSEVVGLYDPQSKKVAASVSAPPGAKPSGVYTNIIDPNDPTGKRVIGMVDTGDKTVHQVATAPDNNQIVTTPTAIYTLDKTTGAVVNKQDITPGAVNKQAVTIGGKVYVFDPAEPDPNKALTLPSNVQAAATVGNTSSIKDLVWYDDQGNEVGRQPNPNYGKAPVTAPTPNTVAPMIQVPESQVTPGGDPSKLVWIPNQGQVTASDALKNVASHLSGQVIDGKISVDEAKALIDASNAKMTNDINQQNADTSKATQVSTAAGDVLRNAASNAQTGAGLLQNRVTSATGALTNMMGSIAGSKITSIPGDFGANLVGGLSNWVTNLGGGPDVYDTAARMVQAADPKISGDPTLAQQATQTLGQMLSQYQQQTGTPHPLVQATQAAQQSVQNGGVTAPVTAPVTQPVVAPTPIRPPVPAQGVSAGGFVAPISAAPGANYGAGTAYTGGVAPWLAQPQPSFIAPMIPTA